MQTSGASRTTVSLGSAAPVNSAWEIAEQYIVTQYYIQANPSSFPSLWEAWGRWIYCLWRWGTTRITLALYRPYSGPISPFHVLTQVVGNVTPQSPIPKDTIRIPTTGHKPQA
jgi:hypothetical protein